MSWLVLTLASVVVVSIATILQKVLMKDDKSNPYAYGIVFHLLLGFLNLGCALWYGSEFTLGGGSVLLLLLVAFLWSLTTIFFFKALQVLEASEVEIISTLKVVVTIVASVILLGEVFDFQNILGALTIVVATLLVIHVRGGFKFNRGVLYTLAMSLFSGLALVFDSMNVQHFDVIAYNTVQNFLSGFILFLVYPKVLSEWKNFLEFSFLKKMLPIGICSTLQGLLYLQALTYLGYTAQIGTIRQSSIVFTVLLSAIFLHDREHLMRKVLAAVLVTFGVLLLR